MTDRHSGYIVVLKDDIREDDAQAILSALRMIKGVISVEPIIGGVDSVIAKERARQELFEKVLEVFKR